MNPLHKRFPILQFFACAHLPPHLREVSQGFFALAHLVAGMTPDTEGEAVQGVKDLRDSLPFPEGAGKIREIREAKTKLAEARRRVWGACESTAGTLSRDAHLECALRLILEARDCAVRGALPPAKPAPEDDGSEDLREDWLASR